MRSEKTIFLNFRDVFYFYKNNLFRNIVSPIGDKLTLIIHKIIVENRCQKRNLHRYNEKIFSI